MCAKSKTKNLIRLVRILQREINGPDILIYTWVMKMDMISLNYRKIV